MEGKDETKNLDELIRLRNANKIQAQEIEQLKCELKALQEENQTLKDQIASQDPKSDEEETKNDESESHNNESDDEHLSEQNEQEDENSQDSGEPEGEPEVVHPPQIYRRLCIIPARGIDGIDCYFFSYQDRDNQILVDMKRAVLHKPAQMPNKLLNRRYTQQRAKTISQRIRSQITHSKTNRIPADLLDQVRTFLEQEQED